MLTILSGVVLALDTPCGLVRHRWVLISEWMTTLADPTADPDVEPGGLGLALALCMLLCGALLWTGGRRFDVQDAAGLLADAVGSDDVDQPVHRAPGHHRQAFPREFALPGPVDHGSH